LGALFAFALIPLLRDHAGYTWAFAVPGVFMAISASVFASGTRFYVRKSPGRDAESAARARTVGRIVLVLLPVPVFWALYDQINSSWVLQGERMQPFLLGGFKVDAERMQSVSALLVLFWVPVLTLGVYPLAERLGWRPTPLRRMGWGMVFAAASFVICAGLQQRLENGAHLSLAWQLAPYAVLELGEVLVSATGLEFAYSQAPRSLKSFVMSLWLLTTVAGNFLVATITWVNAHFVRASGAAEFLFYAFLMLLVAAVFGLIARRYRAAGSAEGA
jgi:POT family proton-dependent oligopeptide transporter